MRGQQAPQVRWRPPRDGVWPPIVTFGRWLLRRTLPWLLGFRVLHRERVPAAGGVLVIANHLADIDPPFFASAVDPRPCQYMALARHFTRRPLSDLLFALGAFPVRIGEADARAMRYAREQLELGRLVVIWPEGAPSWGAEMGEFQEGAGLLGLTPGVTVVPAAIWGSHKVLRGWRPVGRGPVRVSFGHPLEIPAEGTRRERGAELTRRAREAVGELLEPMVRERP